MLLVAVAVDSPGQKDWAKGQTLMLALRVHIVAIWPEGRSIYMSCNFCQINFKAFLYINSDGLQPSNDGLHPNGFFNAPYSLPADVKLVWSRLADRQVLCQFMLAFRPPRPPNFNCSCCQGVALGLSIWFRSASKLNAIDVLYSCVFLDHFGLFKSKWSGSATELGSVVGDFVLSLPSGLLDC